MQNETRTLVALGPGRRSEGSALSERAAGFDVRKRQAGPNDNTFFISSRILSQEKRLTNPYRQHAFFHAAVRRVALAISSAPFRIFTDKPKSAETDSLKNRRDAWANLEKRFPALRRDLFDLFHDRGETARKKLKREMMLTIRRFAPSAPLDLVTKAVGLDVIEEGPWFELFSTVNPTMTRSQLWEATVIYLNTDGESFWVPMTSEGDFWSPPETVPSAGNQAKYVPAEIWPFGKKGWAPRFNKDSKVLEGWNWKDSRSGALSFTGGRPHEFDVEQIVHFKFFDPGDFFRGLSPYEALDIELKQDYNASRFNNAFFEQGAQMSGYFIFEEGLTDIQRDDFVEQFTRDHVSVDNAWKPGLVEGKSKWQPSGVTQRDMQFFRLREWVRDETLSVVGTPKSEMGIFEDVNRASALVSKRVFWENTNLPIIHYTEDLLYSTMFNPVTGGTIFGLFDLSVIEALREDLTGKTEVATSLFAMGVPLNDINERLELGFEPYPWGKVGWISKNLVPVFTDPSIEPPPPEPTSGPDGGGEDDDEGDEGDDVLNPTDSGDEGGDEGDGKPEDEEGTDDGEENSRPMGSRPPVGLSFRGEYGTREQRVARFWDHIFARVMRPGEKKIKRLVKNLTPKWRAASLAAIGDTVITPTTTAEDILFNANPFKRELHEAIKPILEDIFDAASAEAEEELVEIGLVRLDDFRPISSRVDEFDFEVESIIEGQAERIERIVSTVRGVLEESLDAGIKGGADNEGLKSIVRQRFKIFSSSFWLNRTAGTESALATSTARELVFRRRQVPSNVWLNAGDDRVRDDHVTLDDGIPRPIGFNFGKLLGPGIVLMYPLDPNAPADQTILCRCALIPSQTPPVDSKAEPIPPGGNIPGEDMAFIDPKTAVAMRQGGPSPPKVPEQDLKKIRKLDDFIKSLDDPILQKALRENPELAEQLQQDYARDQKSGIVNALRAYAKNKGSLRLGKALADSNLTDEELEAFAEKFGVRVGTKGLVYEKIVGFKVADDEFFGGAKRLFPEYKTVTMSRREWLATRIADEVHETWASTSADHSVKAFGLQRAGNELAKKLGFTPSTTHFKDAAWRESAKFFKEHQNVYRKIVEESYRLTQEDLKGKNIKVLKLFRGMGGVKDPALSAEPNKVEIGTQPLSSFAADPGVANYFAYRGDIIMSITVRAEQIFGCARDGWGCYIESEYLVFGNTMESLAYIYE